MTPQCIEPVSGFGGVSNTRSSNFYISISSNVCAVCCYTEPGFDTIIRFGGGRTRQGGFDEDDVHYPTRPVDKDKAEHELVINIKKATSPEETAPKQKHVRSEIYVNTLDHT